MAPVREAGLCDPTDPRVMRTRAAVHEAAIEVMVEDGIVGLTIEAVALRAGVARTTIYRNWNSKAELVVDAFGSMVSPPETQPGGDTRQDLLKILGHLSGELPDSRWASVIAALVAAAEHDPDLAREKEAMVKRRQQAITKVIRSAIDRGQLDADADPQIMLSMLVGPLFYRRLLSRERLDGDLVPELVDRVLSAFGYDPQNS